MKTCTKPLQPFFLFFLAILPFFGTAECMTINIYRPASALASGVPYYIYHQGKFIGKLSYGTGLSYTVSSNAQHIFNASSSEKSVSLFDNVKIPFEDGGMAYIKFVPAPVKNTFKRMPNDKAILGWNKVIKNGRGCATSSGRNSNGITGNPSRSGNSNWSSGSSSSSAPEMPSQNGGLPITIQEGDFEFYFYKMEKSGSNATLHFKVTNKNMRDDKTLTYNNHSRYFDDQGNEGKLVRQICISNSCTQAGHHSYGRERKSNLMPSGIPLNGQVKFVKISNHATKLIRFDLNCGDFSIRLTDIVFPKTIISPCIHLAGADTVRLDQVYRKGSKVIAHFVVSNASKDDKMFGIKGGTVYDDQGNQYKVNDVTIGSDSGNRQWRQEIRARSRASFYLHINDVDETASKLLRLIIQFEGYELTWKESMEILGR